MVIHFSSEKQVDTTDAEYGFSAEKLISHYSKGGKIMIKIMENVMITVTGNIKTVDDLGRAVIPKRIRGFCKVDKGDGLEVSTEGNLIILRKAAPDDTASPRIDDLGRFTIPVDIRRALGISYGVKLDVYTDGSVIVLEKYAPACGVCDSEDDVRGVNRVYLCGGCRVKLT